ncbi:lactonase family protein [Soonwooa sp.]|uniref:lactonase family protein n=1 Tax=Soonwooa sp. TaxID=1938592 RepID=UPI00260674D2|nr:lactonase family protein [Soonwooa sp.]
MKKLPLFAALFFASTLFAQQTFVFFGSFNWDKNKTGIYVYELNSITGKLKKVTTAKGIKNPSYITLSQDGKFVFACTDTKTEKDGSISSFAFNPEQKSLSFINSQKSGGENPVYLSVDQSGKWLVNGNYTEGSASIYAISEKGFISPFAQNFQFAEGSINPKRQDRAHIHSTVFSPDFEYVFMPDLGADKIRAYKFDKNNPKPLSEAEPSFSQSVLGSGPRHLTFHPNGKYAYCIEEMGGAISVYDYQNGQLKSIQRIFTHPENQEGEFEGSDIHVSPDGRFLYASNRGQENNIAIFSINENGSLKNIGYQSTLGKHPRIFALDESGDFLIATNVQTSDAIVFKRDKETGLLSKLSKLRGLKNVSCVKIKTYQ